MVVLLSFDVGLWRAFEVLGCAWFLAGIVLMVDEAIFSFPRRWRK